MYGPPGDFGLAAAAEAPAPDAPDRPTSYPAWLLDGWKFRQRLWDGDDFRADPAAYHLAEALLLRAERDWLRGADEAQTAKDLKADLDRLKKRLAAPPPADLASLGAYVAQGRNPTRKRRNCYGRRSIPNGSRRPPAPPRPRPRPSLPKRWRR